jgi:hypothetical protein
MTCSAYERDVSACLGYLEGERIEELAEVKVTHLRAFLASEQNMRPDASSQARTTAALKLFFGFLVEGERLVRGSRVAAADAEEARGASGRADDGRARAPLRGKLAATRSGSATSTPSPSAIGCSWR